MINVIVADHEPIFRAGIVTALAAEEDIRIVAQPHSGTQLTKAVAKRRSDVLILATKFLEFLAEVGEVASPHPLAVLLLAENAEQASNFTPMGVQGVIYRSASSNVVVEAVRRLSRGESFLQSPSLDKTDISSDLIGRRVRDRLTDRELCIVAGVVQGYKNREVAVQMNTSEQTIKNALRNIFDKVGVFDRLELALFVIHHRTLAKACQPEQIRVENVPSRQ
jgi:DNA-binding NarL/FixJ family response regulator